MRAKLMDNGYSLFFECPGCGNLHGIDTRKWSFDGNLDLPTISPSILCHPHPGQPRCHSFVKAGRIQFLADCEHGLAGKTVDLPDLDADEARGEKEGENDG